MIFSLFVLLTALLLSAVSAYYSIIGLTAIFAGAAIPIIIMGATLEISKIMAILWCHTYWERCSIKLKLYLIPAIILLMLITSMGTFGYLSNAHISQTVPSGDIQAQVSLFDEKIKTQRDNIDSSRKALMQMDSVVDQMMARTNDENGATKSANLRRLQTKERAKFQQDIDIAQKSIVKLQEERAPIASKYRKAEADTGPIKYIAAMVYGDKTDQNILEAAVRWVIVIIVLVFDPLAVVLILAATTSIDWYKEDKGKDEKEKASTSKKQPEPDNGFTTVRDAATSHQAQSEAVKKDGVAPEETNPGVASAGELVREYSEENAVPIPVLSETMVSLNEEKHTYQDESSILSEFGYTVADVTPQVAEDNEEGIEYIDTSATATAISEVIDEEENSKMDKDEALHKLSQTLGSIEEYGPSSSDNAGIEAEDISSTTVARPKLQTVEDGISPITWPELQMAVLDEKEEVVSTRSLSLPAAPPVTFIRSPQPARISTREGTVTIPDKTVVADTPPQALTHTHVAVEVPKEVVQNSILRELLGSRTHFIPQKVNEEEKHTQIKSKEPAKPDDTVIVISKSAPETAAQIEAVSKEGQKISKKEADIQSTHKEQLAGGANHKYPVTLSWLTEFKRSQNG